ncbi:MAG: Fe-S cluster assembly protein SufD [Elainellaceae cyanobacterium]
MIQVSPTSDTDRQTSAQKREAYLNQLLDAARSSQTNLDWLHELQEQAAVRVHEQSFPTTRDEEWRFTDLSSLMQVKFQAVPQHYAAANVGSVEDFTLPEVENARLVFVNGVYSPSLSILNELPEGLQVSNLSALSPQQSDRLQPYLGKQAGAEEVFTALNTAGLTDAAVIWVAKNAAIDIPIHLLFVSTTGEQPALIQPRVLVIAEPNSAVTLIEDHVAVGEGVYFTNSVTEIWVEENAEVKHTRLQRDGHAAFHIGKTAVSQARTARYTCNTISFGAQLSRHHLNIYQTGEQTETTLNGLAMIAGEQLADLHSAIALTKPYGISRQLHKCIVDDKAHAVFNGKVFVPQAAQMTDAGQLNRTLLLSPKARVDTKPQLEIVADNVKCTHGATVGQLEADELFYLQSRGIDTDSARNLLVYAFAYEVIDQVPLDSLKQVLSRLVTSTGRL